MNMRHSIEAFTDRGDGDSCCSLNRETISAGANRWESDCSNPILFCKLHRIQVAFAELLIFAVLAPSPNWANRMNDKTSRQIASRGYLRLTSRTTSQLAAFLEQSRTGSSMYRSVHTTAPKQTCVGSVNDRVYLLLCDVTENQSNRCYWKRPPSRPNRRLSHRKNHAGSAKASASISMPLTLLFLGRLCVNS